MSKETRKRNEKTDRKFTGMILIFGCIFLPASGYYFSSRIYNFSKYGLEKPARVIQVVKTATGKGGITYVTKLEIENKLVETSLRYNLPIGEKFCFLVIPDTPNEITLGKKNSSLFDLYAYSVGGHELAFLTAVL
jgi:hypothetical protein